MCFSYKTLTCIKLYTLMIEMYIYFIYSQTYPTNISKIIYMHNIGINLKLRLIQNWHEGLVVITLHTTIQVLPLGDITLQSVRYVLICQHTYQYHIPRFLPIQYIPSTMLVQTSVSFLISQWIYDMIFS